MNRSRLPLVLLPFAGVLVAVAIGSYKVGENRSGGPEAASTSTS